MAKQNTELLYALLAIGLITGIYLVVTLPSGHTPESESFGGHMLGVVGFGLMLLTELLYSARKRARRAARWGSTETWLRFHIFTGLVGPYLVLLHTSWNLNGLAGIVTILTLVIVVSGFVGRYIYSMIPRTVDGTELALTGIESQEEYAASGVKTLIAVSAGLGDMVPRNLFYTPVMHDNIWAILGEHALSELRFNREWRKTKRQLNRIMDHGQITYLEQMLMEQRKMQYQRASIMASRRLLSLWHSIHVPIGLALFTLAFIHIGAAAYFVTLAR